MSAGLIVVVACAVIGINNRTQIALALFTDSAVLEQFRSIDVGDRGKDVLAAMGEPHRKMQVTDLTIDGREYDSVLTWIWPRYGNTSFAVLMVDGVVVKKYENYGS